MDEEIRLIGTVCGAPQAFNEKNGTTRALIKLATSRANYRPGGDRQYVSTWWHVRAVGVRAKYILDHVKSGDLVLIKGYMQPDEGGNPKIWHAEDGSAQARYDVFCLLIKIIQHRHPPGEDVPELLPEEPGMIE